MYVYVLVGNVCHVYTNLTALNMFLENRCEAACASKQIHATHEKAKKLTSVLLSIEYNIRQKQECAARMYTMRCTPCDVHQEQRECETG